MHSSLNFLVSGQAQQIFFFGFVSAGGACSVFSVESEASVAPDAVFPISDLALLEEGAEEEAEPRPPPPPHARGFPKKEEEKEETPCAVRS